MKSKIYLQNIYANYKCPIILSNLSCTQAFKCKKKSGNGRSGIAAFVTFTKKCPGTERRLRDNFLNMLQRLLIWRNRIHYFPCGKYSFALGHLPAPSSGWIFYMGLLQAIHVRYLFSPSMWDISSGHCSYGLSQMASSQKCSKNMKPEIRFDPFQKKVWKVSSLAIGP